MNIERISFLNLKYINNNIRTAFLKQSSQFAFSGVKRQREVGDQKGKPLWKPGQPCPVLGCRLNDNRLQKNISRNNFRVHWLEKHEPMVSMYQCPQCSLRSKRKTDLYQHLRVIHGYVGDVSSVVLSYGFWPNKSFVDPSPLTQEIVFGNIIMSQNVYPK